MNNIEVIIGLLLVFMAVPDLCQRVRRPALIFPVFVLIGFFLGPWVDDQVAIMLKQAGYVGFLLLLFEVGLEIDLPGLRQFLPSLRQAAGWAAIQYPVALLLAWQAGLSTPQAFLAAAALTGCSVGMAHCGWKTFPFSSAATRQSALLVMVALEMISIVVMAVGSTALRQGFSWWILAHLLGMAVTVMGIARYATHLVGVFQRIIDRTIHWRLHWLALLILAICAVGQRLGLDAAKTAFVLGLCMSRAKHQGMNLEACMAPLSQRFLIPLFFVALGLHIEWRMLLSLPAVIDLGAAGLLLGLREVLYRRWLSRGGSGPVYLLFSPNLTMVALAASALVEYGHAPEAAAWILLTGLFVTVPAIALLPAPGAESHSVPKSTAHGGERRQPLSSESGCTQEIPCD